MLGYIGALLTAISAIAQAPGIVGQWGTNSCLYISGPDMGTVQYFAGFPQIAVGSPCRNNAGSVGFAVPDGTTSSLGDFSGSLAVPQCVDLVGIPVPYQYNTQIPKSGLATMTNSGPIIFLRPADMARFTDSVGLFLYAHECGHHALGQVRAGFAYGIQIGPDQELSADCFAMNMITRYSLLGPVETAQVLAFLQTVPGDPTTYPGPDRVTRIRLQCPDPRWP